MHTLHTHIKYIWHPASCTERNIYYTCIVYTRGFIFWECIHTNVRANVRMRGGNIRINDDNESRTILMVVDTKFLHTITEAMRTLSFVHNGSILNAWTNRFKNCVNDSLYMERPINPPRHYYKCTFIQPSLKNTVQMETIPFYFEMPNARISFKSKQY